MNNLVIKNNINAYLENYFKEKGSYNKVIYDSVAYSLNVGGKRIRPILMILAYSMYEKNWEEIIEIAGAIEMIHTYSLIHDDLPAMDNDDLRRGMPTNHIKFGEDISILAGDALLNEAMSIMMKYSLKHGEKALRAAIEITDAAGPEGMIGGQVVDIKNEGKIISKDELHYMHSKKTGELIRAAIVSGGILGGASEEDINILNQFGEKLGLVFQIKDDLLDVIGDTKVLGKNTLSDEENKKSNFITLYGLDYCKDECERLSNQCIEMLNKLSRNAEHLKNLTKELLIREY